MESGTGGKVRRRRIELPFTEASRLVDSQLEDLIREQCRRIPLQLWEIDALLANCKRRGALDKGLAIVYEYAGYIDRIKQLMNRQYAHSDQVMLHFSALDGAKQSAPVLGSHLREQHIQQGVQLFKSWVEINVEIAIEVSSWRRIQWCPRPLLCQHNHTQYSAIVQENDSPTHPGKKKLTFQARLRQQTQQFLKLLAASPDGPFIMNQLVEQCPLHLAACLAPCFAFEQAKEEFFLSKTRLQTRMFAIDQVFIALRNIYFLEDGVATTYRSFHPKTRETAGNVTAAGQEKMASGDVYSSFPMLRLIYPGFSFPTEQFKWFWDADAVYRASTEVLFYNLGLGTKRSDLSASIFGSPDSAAGKPVSQSLVVSNDLQAAAAADRMDIGSVALQTPSLFMAESSLEDISYTVEHLHPDAPFFPLSDSVTGGGPSVGQASSIVEAESIIEVSQHSTQQGVEAIGLSLSLPMPEWETSARLRPESDDAEGSRLGYCEGGADVFEARARQHEEERVFVKSLSDQDKRRREDEEKALLEAVNDEKQRLERLRQQREELENLRALSEEKERVLDALAQERKRLKLLQKQEEAEKRQLDRDAADKEKAEKEKERVLKTAEAKLKKEEQKIVEANKKSSDKKGAAASIKSTSVAKDSREKATAPKPAPTPVLLPSSQAKADSTQQTPQQMEQRRKLSISEVSSSQVMVASPQKTLSIANNVPKNSPRVVSARAAASKDQFQREGSRSTTPSGMTTPSKPSTPARPNSSQAHKIRPSGSPSERAKHSRTMQMLELYGSLQHPYTRAEARAESQVLQIVLRQIDEEGKGEKNLLRMAVRKISIWWKLVAPRKKFWRRMRVKNTMISIVDSMITDAVLKSNKKRRRRAQLLRNGAALTLQRWYCVVWNRPVSKSWARQPPDEHDPVDSNFSSSSNMASPIRPIQHARSRSPGPIRKRPGASPARARAKQVTASKDARESDRQAGAAAAEYEEKAAVAWRSPATAAASHAASASDPGNSTERIRPDSPQNLLARKLSSSMIESGVVKVIFLAEAGLLSTRSSSGGSGSAANLNTLTGSAEGLTGTKSFKNKGVFTSSIGTINLNLALSSRSTGYAQGISKITDEKHRSLLMGSKKTAAVIIQCKMRHFLSKKRVLNKKQELWVAERERKKNAEWSNPRTRPHAAATLIQSFVRGSWDRSRICRLIRAALVLNNVYRRNVALVQLKKNLRRIDRPLQITLRGVRNLPAMIYEATSSIKIKVSVYWAPLLHIVTENDLKSVIQGKFPQFTVTTELKPLERILTQEEESQQPIVKQKSIMQSLSLRGTAFLHAGKDDDDDGGNDSSSSSEDEDDKGSEGKHQKSKSGSGKLFQLPKIPLKWTTVVSRLQKSWSKKIAHAITSKPKRSPISPQGKCLAVFGETIKVPACHGNSVVKFEIFDEFDKKISTATFMLASHGRLMFWKAEMQLPLSVMGMRRAVPEKGKGSVGGASAFIDQGPMLEVFVGGGIPLRSKCGWAKVKVKGYGPIRSILGKDEAVKSFLFEKWHRLYFSLDGEVLGAYEQKSSTVPIFTVETKYLLSCEAEKGEFIEEEEGQAKTAVDDNYNVIIEIKNSTEKLVFRFGDSGSRVQWCDALNKIVEENIKAMSSEIESASFMMPEMFMSALRSSKVVRATSLSHLPAAHTLSQPNTRSSFAGTSSSESAKSESSKGGLALQNPIKRQPSISIPIPFPAPIAEKAMDLFKSKQEIQQRQNQRRASTLKMQLSEQLQTQRSIKGALPGMDDDAFLALRSRHGGN